MPVFDNGFEAWVEVDGGRLQEFDVQRVLNDKRAPVLGCWIPSVSGKEFKIGFKLPKGQVKKHHHSFTVHMDGEIVEVATGFVERDQRRTISKDIVVKFGEELVGDGKTIRNFRFGTLEVTEDDSDIGRAHEDLGKIEICLSSVLKLVKNKTGCSTSKGGTARKTDRIHEGQKKKGLTHSIQLGEEKEYDGPELDSVKYVGCADVCSFQFWYRAIETLIADGKAPGRNPPAPVASLLSNASRASGHLAEPANRNRDEDPPDEDEGLEYVTPEPAPQQNQHTNTVPSVNPASTSGPLAAEQGVTQPDTTVGAISTSVSPSKQGPRTREQARKEDRGDHGTGRGLRSQTLSESSSARCSPSQRSNLPRGHTTAPQASPGLPSIPEARQPVEVIEISDDDDEGLAPVKVEETESTRLVKSENSPDNIHQGLRDMTIEAEPTPSPRSGPSTAAAPRRLEATTSLKSPANPGGKKKQVEDIEMSDEEEDGSDASVHDSEIEAWQKAADALTHLAKLKSKRRLSGKRANHTAKPTKRAKTEKP